MKFVPLGTTSARRQSRACTAAFTLAEVLAALLLLAIVIPVAMQGLRIASRAGEVADRKSEAARVAEKLMSDILVSTNWTQSQQGGNITEGARAYQWKFRNENWQPDAMQMLTVEVSYQVQDQLHSVQLCTLVDSSVLTAQPAAATTQ